MATFFGFQSAKQQEQNNKTSADISALVVGQSESLESLESATSFRFADLFEHIICVITHAEIKAGICFKSDTANGAAYSLMVDNIDPHSSYTKARRYGEFVLSARK